MYFDHTFCEDTVGEVIFRWKGTGYVNLSEALVGALEFYEMEFPEILA